MKKPGPKLQPLKTIIPIYLFLFVILVLFVVNVIIALPVDTPQDIPSLDLAFMDEAEVHRDHFILPAESYDLGSCFGVTHMRSSALRFYTKTYYFYVATVYPDNGEPYQMPVRMPQKKADIVDSGGTVDLYGRMAHLDDKGGHSYLSDWYEATEYSPYPSTSCCLNDGGETTLSRSLTSIAFALASVVVLYVIFHLSKVQRVFMMNRKKYIGVPTNEIDETWN